MGNPNYARTSASGSGRTYTDPVTGDEYPSVTTVMGALAKPLAGWAAKSAAEFAVENLSGIVDLVDAGQHSAAVELIKGAPWRKRDKAANLGSAVHDAAEAWVLDKPMPSWDEGVEPYMVGFVQWLEDFMPEFEMTEATVANPVVGYAGALDCVCRIPVLDKRLVIDYKSGKGIYADVALQLSAYRYATEVWLPNAIKEPMPETDGGAVLHLKPGGYEFRPVFTGAAEFAAFCAARTAYVWKRENERRVICAPIPAPAVA